MYYLKVLYLALKMVCMERCITTEEIYLYRNYARGYSKTKGLVGVGTLHRQNFLKLELTLE